MRAFIGCTLSALFGACAATWLLEARLQASERRHEATERRHEALVAQLQERRLSAAERQLGGIFVTDAPTGTSGALAWTGVGQGCMGIPMAHGTGADHWKSGSALKTAPVMNVAVESATSCNGQYCPDCFYFHETSDSNTRFVKTDSDALTALPKFQLWNCHIGKWGTGNSMGSTPISDAAREYLFINQQSHKCDSSSCGLPVRIEDKATSGNSGGRVNSYVLHPMSHVTAYCQAGAASMSIDSGLIFPWNPTKLENGCPKGCDPQKGGAVQAHRVAPGNAGAYKRGDATNGLVYSGVPAVPGAAAGRTRFAEASKAIADGGSTNLAAPEVLDAAWERMTLSDFLQEVPATTDNAAVALMKTADSYATAPVANTVANGHMTNVQCVIPQTAAEEKTGPVLLGDLKCEVKVETCSGTYPEGCTYAGGT